MRPRESLQVLDSAQELARVASETVLAQAREAMAARGRFHLALAGGTTPRDAYRELAGRIVAQERWHAWFGDERCVPPDHPDSNFRMASEVGLLERLPEKQVHRLRGEASDPRAEALRYEAELCGELGVPPRLDLILLGLGADGHTASLFPGSPALEALGWVASGPAPRPPHQRLTLTFPTLLAARAVIFLVAGVDKAAILGAVLGAASRTEIPARRIHPQDGRLLWLVERSAVPVQEE